MSGKVSLTPQLFLGEGSDHKCFRHPHEPGLCIKLLHPEKHPRRFRREINYLLRLRRRAVNLRHIAAYHGEIETSLGRGALFDLVLDDDGRVSRSLAHYLDEADQRFESWIVREIEVLKRDFYDQWIVFHDLNPTNILVQRRGFDEFRLVVIHGIGHNHLIPLASYNRSLAHRKLIRVWNRRYLKWFANFPAIVNRLKPYPVIRL